MLADVAGDEVVHADHVMAAVEQVIAEVRADEAGGAGDEDSLARGGLSRHGVWPKPRNRVRIRILMSSSSDQFSM